MEALSWTEVDDLRANLRADERARFDGEIHDLAVAGGAADEAAYAALIDRWRRVVGSRPDLVSVHYPVAHRVGWASRLHLARH